MNTEWRAEYMPTPKTLTYHDEQGFCRRYGRLLRSEEPTIAFDGGFFHHGRRCGRERHRDVLPLDEVLMVPFSPPPPLIATVSSKFEEHMADLCVRIAAQCCKQAEDRFFCIVTCATHIPADQDLEIDGLDTKLPRGWYRIGSMQIRHDTGWFNLYRRKATGNGYWDFYTNIPERNCVGGFGLHAGENITGSITVKDKKCFDRLVNQIERKSTTQKFEVHQCRKCIFNSCWLGTRRLIDERTYLTNLRST
ncbi:hypothetical protein QR680_014718 [Steinernema hermaphroditum]|uniref:Uncharacterized protein n=1 Tax=Steinernema hermaphroditum TaxID=289476 RepID=A0AA39IC64_9BILA|nr:hypothetical protein QR680_014718 [Steinernema hermaphroditum]